MKHIAFIDCGIQCVPYKSVKIKTNIDAKTVEKILDAVSERFKIIVRQHKKNVDSTDKFYSLEEAIDIVKNTRFTYKFEQCKREYTIPNTKNNDDIIINEL